MYAEKKIIVVMPAFNAAKTIRKTYDETMAEHIVDEIILVDDASTDNTLEIANTLENMIVHVHEKNKGYGGNQKTCYKLALKRGADIVIMIHPDYQYTPKLIPAMAGMIVNDLYKCVLASRILGGQALAGGMPLWRYAANRFLTYVENIMLGASLSEYHTGYRAFSGDLLEILLKKDYSDDFIFDNEILAEIIRLNHLIGEISCPTYYHLDSSSISLAKSITYGLGCIKVGIKYRLAKLGLFKL